MQYAIWDKVSPVYTPSGAVFTAEEWMDKYPIAKTNAHILCAASIINGSVFAVLEQMIEEYERRGCDFTGCNSPQDYLGKIEEHDAEEAERRAEEAEEAARQRQEEYERSILDNQRIADALEDLVVLNMPDIEEVL